MCNTNTINDKSDIIGNADGDTRNNCNTHNNTCSKLLLKVWSIRGHLVFVASVWVHKRRHTGQTMQDVQKGFVVCFGKATSSSPLILVWGKNTFATGSATQWY